MISVIAISIGAAIGSLARWRLGVWLNTGAAASTSPLLPWGTLAANMLGGYLIGVCVAIFQSLPELDPVWRLAIVTGFLGGLTTFSSFSAEVVGMLQQERYMTQNNTYFAFTNTAGTTSPATVPFKTFSGDSAAKAAYYLQASACTSSTIKECVMVEALPVMSDPEAGTLQILSTGTKTCSGGTNSAVCWK